MSNLFELPKLALSVRQPWAHGIVWSGKDIENRSWGPGNPGLKFRGRVAIHAAAGMTREEYEDAAETFQEIGVACPPASVLVRGAIIGVAEVVDVVRKHDSPWFFGPIGLVLRNAAHLAGPIPCKGQLGFFPWQRSGELPPPAKWMLPKEPKAVKPAKAAERLPDLFD